MSTFNRQGEDWRILREKLKDIVATARGAMEAGTSFEDYNFYRGHVAVVRQICEWADPTTPPVTEEDTYGISDPDAED